MSTSTSGSATLVTGARGGRRRTSVQSWLTVVVALLLILGGQATLAEAAAPAVTFSPTSLTFGAQDIGSTSAAQTVTVANTGTAPLFINSAATRGTNALDFTEVNDGCS